MAYLAATNLTTTSATPATGIATLILDASGKDTLANFAVSGTYGSVSFAFTGTIDGTNFFPIAAKSLQLNSSLSGTISPADNSVLAYWVQTAGLAQVRLSVSAIGSGTLVVTATANAFTDVPTLGAAQANTLLYNNATGNGIGYTTGSGGAVTQITSKATGVTLNTMSGQVTLNNAALASAATVSFVVTNSNSLATDVPTVVHSSAGTAGAYTCSIGGVSAGSFRINVTNNTGGSLSEAPVLSFNIYRGANS